MDKSKDDEDKQDPNLQPGSVISPGSSPVAPVPKEELPAATEPQPDLPTPEVPTTQPNTEASAAPDKEPQNYKVPDNIDSKGAQSVTWTASEFIAHDKSVSWYLGLSVVAVLLAALIFLVTKDAVSVAVVIVAGIILGIYGSHKPRQLEYKVDQGGISIANKYHDFQEFKSFFVVKEGAFAAITFMPLKRFSPTLTVYFAPEDEDKILAVLSAQLPYEEPRRDAVESLMRRIRF